MKLALTIAASAMLFANAEMLEGSSHRARSEAMTGTILAYRVPLLSPCINGNAYASVLIHVQRAQAVGAELVRLDFSYPCDQKPSWFSQPQELKKFRLIRSPLRDEALREFTPMKDETGKTPDMMIPEWQRTQGADHMSLPFGRTVPSFESPDYPSVPIL
jgi:hypothetical protein